MKTLCYALAACAAVCAEIPNVSFADSVVSLHVDVQNPPSSPSPRVASAGTYVFSATKSRIQVVSPDGTIMIFDFDKRVVSVLAPKQKTFYQLKQDDFLSQGEKLPAAISSKFSEKTTVNFDPTVNQESRPILKCSCVPYSLDLEALVSPQSRRSSGGGFGRRRGGGFPGGGGGGQSGGGFPGDPTPGNSSHLMSTGVKVGGQLWLADFTPGDCDRAQLATAEAAALMTWSPGLKGLVDKIRKSNLTLMGADYSVSVLDSQGQVPSKVPVVSVETTAIDSPHLDASLFLIPSDYTKVDAPPFLLGSGT